MYSPTVLLSLTLFSYCHAGALPALTNRGITPKPRAPPEGEAFNTCPAASWPPRDVGVPISSQVPNADLQAALPEVSAQNIQGYIEKLVSFGNRHTASTQTDPNYGIGAAINWTRDTMQSFADQSDGRMTVEVQSYIQQPDGNRITFPTKINNVIATIRGSETPDRYYVTSGHIDSRVTDVLNYEGIQPGADDDGSGVAVSIEIARVLATRQPRSTIVLTVVSGEEQGLFGSNNQARVYRQNNINVAGMLDNDIVGSSTGDDGTKDPYSIRLFGSGTGTATESSSSVAQLLSVGGENDTPSRNLGRFLVEVAQNSYTGMQNVALIYRLDRFLRGGDHRSFITNGYLSAVRFTEPNEDFKHQHQDVRVEDGVQYGDLPEFVDYDYVARVARVNLAGLWSLSEAPAVPSNVAVNASILDNNSAFLWTPVDDANVKSYEVVWRPTDSPFWTHAIDVALGTPQGNRVGATVPLSKDNVIFGLRSVGFNGFKSPATFALLPA